MKADSMERGKRPTAKSTATSGRKTPSPNTRKRRVRRSAENPATPPAKNRRHGSARIHAHARRTAAATIDETRRVASTYATTDMSGETYTRPPPLWGYATSEEHTPEL